MLRRILIIDSDEGQLSELQSVLEGKGYLVEKALDGLQGYHAGKQFKPDLVITEILTNRLSGFELSSRIASEGEFRAPVIFYSSFYRDLEARQEVIAKYSAHSYFVKPAELKDLTQAIAVLFDTTAKDNSAAAKLPGIPAPTKQRGKKFKEEIQRSKPGAEHANSSRVTPSISQPLPKDPGLDGSSISGAGAAAVLAKSAKTEKSTPGFFLNPPKKEEKIRPENKDKKKSLTKPTVDVSLPVGSKSNREQSPLPGLLPWQRITRSPALKFIVGLALVVTALVVFRRHFSEKDLWPIRQPQDQGVAVPPVSSPPTANLSPATLSQPSDQDSAGYSEEVRAKINTPPASLKTKPARAKSAPFLMISDVTGLGKTPFLRKSSRPKLSQDMLQSPSGKPFVVRVVIGQDGKVLEATALNDEEIIPSLKDAILDSVQSWQFKPVKSKEDATWTKYYSFSLSQEGK